MNKIIETLRRKWFDYFMETLVIMSSILIAFALRTWSENRKAKLDELITLKAIHKDLEEHAYLINYTMSFDSLEVKSNLVVVDHLSNKLPYNDSLSYHIRNMVRTNQNINVSAAYETLKANGLGVISNDSILNKIIYTYDEALIIIENHYSKTAAMATHILENELFEHFSLQSKILGDTINAYVPLDYQALLEDHKFNTRIRELYKIKAFALIMTKHFLEELNGNIKDIGKEIERLE